MERLRLVVLSAIALAIIVPATVFAQYTSPGYQTNEVFFGSGGDLDSSSANYKAQSSVGSLGVGNFSSANYQAYSGFLTPSEPFLELQIDTSSVNLGTLDTSTTKTGTATFHVRAYIDSGYTVQTINQPPTYTSGLSSHTLTAMSLGGSVVGTEQFGMNLKANTSPASFGIDPSPQPDGTFATGIAAPGYNTANQYKYNAGDTIACTGSAGTCGSVSGWGLTNFTIAYIANISIVTPAGNYSMTQDLVAVATY